LGLYGVAALLKPGRQRFNLSGLLGVSIAFIVALSFLSVLWTADLGLSVRRLVSFGLFCLCAMALARHLKARDIGFLCFFSAGLLLFLNFLFELMLGVFTPFDPDYRFTGAEHANTQGMTAAFLVLSSVMLGDAERAHRRWYYFVAAVGVIFLILTKSRTSFAAAVVAMLAYKKLISTPSRQIRIAFAVALIGLLAFLALGQAAVEMAGHGAYLGRGSGDTMTLNGRIWLWIECRGYLGDRPLLGYGFNGFWSPERMSLISQRQGWVLGDAHSVYLDVALSLGLLGLLAFVIVLITALNRARWAFQLSHDVGYGFLYAFILFFTLHGLLESNFVRPGYAAFMFLAVLASIAYSVEMVAESGVAEV
jgi:O-antigen ligase